MKSEDLNSKDSLSIQRSNTVKFIIDKSTKGEALLKELSNASPNAKSMLSKEGVLSVTLPPDITVGNEKVSIKDVVIMLKTYEIVKDADKPLGLFCLVYSTGGGTCVIYSAK